MFDHHRAKNLVAYGYQAVSQVIKIYFFKIACIKLDYFQPTKKTEKILHKYYIRLGAVIIREI